MHVRMDSAGSGAFRSGMSNTGNTRVLRVLCIMCNRVVPRGNVAVTEASVR